MKKIDRRFKQLSEESMQLRSAKRAYRIYPTLNTVLYTDSYEFASSFDLEVTLAYYDWYGGLKTL